MTRPAHGAGLTALALVLAAHPATAQSTDAIAERLNRMEAQIQALEARNKALEEQIQRSGSRAEAVEHVAKAVPSRPAVATLASEPGSNFSFKARGVIDVEQAAYLERAGGYDYNDGTNLRRARFGFEGTAFRDFKWRIDSEFAGNKVSLQDVLLQYTGQKPFTLTVGQHKAPFGLESNSNDSFSVFLERGMFNMAAGNLGAERRIGLSLAWETDGVTLAAGLFGENDSITRATGTSDSDTPDEGWGINARATWEPVNAPGRLIHLGAAGYWRTDLRSASAANVVTLAERPNVRIDTGNIVSTGTITNVDRAVYLGAEVAAGLGSVLVAAEYGRLRLDRTGPLPNPDLDGFYVYASWFPTGESRRFKGGVVDRLRPHRDFDGKGGWGALELALRYDRADFSETPVPDHRGNKAETVTLGANWHLNPHMKLVFNWIRFNGTNTPLDPIGDKTKGDAFATRLHLDW